MHLIILPQMFGLLWHSSISMHFPPGMGSNPCGQLNRSWEIDKVETEVVFGLLVVVVVGVVVAKWGCATGTRGIRSHR